jgi:hypothetical protein
MNKKNRGFSLFIALVGSMILMGVAVSIITSINSSLEQVNNIARANQLFFAAESGKEAAFFHHNVRGAGLTMPEMDVGSEIAIDHDNIGATVTWGVEGRSTDSFTGEVHENEKITIPLYWDSSTKISENKSIINMTPSNRVKLELDFPENDNSFDFGTADSDVVLFMWSVSRKKAGVIETFIPQPPAANICSPASNFYCKNDFSVGLAIEFDHSLNNGKVLPLGNPMTLKTFMSDAVATNYEISFQPVLPFTALTTPAVGAKISSINFELKGTDVGPIPKNNYIISSKVDFGDFEKKMTTTVKEKPSIGAFDYLIFK